MTNILPFNIIGISVRTSNADGKSAEDLGTLWERFFKEQVGLKIPEKVSDDIYAIYTDYASDYTGEYTCIIGYQVRSKATVGEGLIAHEFSGGKHRKFVAKGKMPEAVANSWREIWGMDAELGRKYTADFEVYGDRSQEGTNAEVDIFIAVA